MAKNKFYAVKVGREPGIYESWKDCEKQIKGFSNAKYKGFTNREEANKFLESENLQDVNTDKKLDIQSDVQINCDIIVSEHLKNNRLVAFTDGGYDGKNKICGYGVCILEPQGTKPIEISDIVRTDRFIHSNNIGPEVMAVISALDWSLANGYDKITIIHDYEGIGKWGRNEWKENSDISKWYIKKLNEKYNDILDIEFIWVPSHKGIKYNEMADKLASEAMKKNTKPQIIFGKTYFTCRSVGETGVNEIIDKIKEDPKIKINKMISDKCKNMWKISKDKEKTTITFHKSSCATVVQGKPNSLFSLFISFYTEKISDFELVAAYSTMRSKRIEFNDVEKIAQSMNLPSNYPNECIKLIKQAISEKIALKNGYNKDAYDFGHYVFPACRALEATIKYLFELNNKHIRKSDCLGGLFQKDKNGFWKLEGQNYKNYRYKDKLENCYNLYSSYRNALGHFGEIIVNDDHISLTRMIDNPEEAVSIIDEILDEIRFD